MKIFSRFIALSLAFVAFSTSNVGAQGLSNGTSALAEQVNKKILRLPYYEVYDHIGFRLDGTTVILTGKVRNAVNRADAEASVERIEGVSKVINEIEILSPSRFDDDIRRNLFARLSNAGGLSSYLWPVNPDVRLIVDRGNITLEGTVRHRGDLNMMNIVARGVPGSFNVTNNLTIENERP